jgi:glycine cleavage system regulatory protein
MSTQINLPQEVQLPTDDDKQFVIVSGIGRDRPGIVYKVARVIRKNGGNIYLQRGMQVVGQFAFVVIASFDADNLRGLAKVVESIGAGMLGDKFWAEASEIDIKSLAHQGEGGTTYVVTIAGDDQMGIVESMTLIVLQNNLNLVSTNFEVAYRPFQGTPTFSAIFEVAVPDGFNMTPFLEELEQFEKNTDLTIIVRKQ